MLQFVDGSEGVVEDCTIKSATPALQEQVINADIYGYVKYQSLITSVHVDTAGGRACSGGAESLLRKSLGRDNVLGEARGCLIDDRGVNAATSAIGIHNTTITSNIGCTSIMSNINTTARVEWSESPSNRMEELGRVI